MAGFLPISPEETRALGWEQVDIVCVTGDAYVDHPSFGMAIVSRELEALGYKVAVLAQPDWKSARDFTKFGRPRLGFFVNGGNIDSMVNNYTAAKRKRHDDSYSPGNVAGRRPDRSLITYCNKIREIYPDIPIVIGGLEASLRRFAHYDYWDDAVRPSILIDSKADLLIYGMGEKQTAEIARRLALGEDPKAIRDIRGTCYLCQQFELPQDAVTCASFHRVSVDKEAHARACRQQLDEHDHVYGKTVVQKQDERYLVQNPPMEPLNQEELDQVFDLPFQRMYHPIYEAQGGVKAIEEVEFSIMHNRGCFGHCNFCSIAFHQGRQVTCRSEESILKEAKSFLSNPRFKGYIHDVGGPTANFRRPSCDKQLKYGLCKNRKCLGTNPCPNLIVDHTENIDLLQKLRKIKGVKKVFVRSGLRFDYIMKDKNDDFMRELIEHHISGQLKVAPEHCSNNVLEMMGKPPIQVYERFVKKFYKITQEVGKEQYLVPYLMSSHPGSTVKDALELALFLKKNNMRPEQVQDFYPTPGTVSTCMFFTGINPLTMEPVYVPRTMEEKRFQRALLQYYKPENRRIIIEALSKIGREDLIGTGKDCLVPPDREYIAYRRAKSETAPRTRAVSPSKAGGKRAGKKPAGKHTSKRVKDR